MNDIQHILFFIYFVISKYIELISLLSRNEMQTFLTNISRLVFTAMQFFIKVCISFLERREINSMYFEIKFKILN